jgi:hypothetical protein
LTATLTATSADDGCGGWVVGGIVALAEGVDGVALEAESDVGVNADGDADVGVAEEFLNLNTSDLVLLAGSVAAGRWLDAAGGAGQGGDG